jgi:hypothetical protein
VFLAVGVAVVALLLSQFGTIRDTASPVVALDEDLTRPAAGPLPAPWRDARGAWATGPEGAGATDAAPQLTMAVRPLDGVDGTVAVSGPLDVDGWSVVARWVDSGSYALAVVEPDEGTVSLVAVVSDRTRLLGTGPLPPPPEGVAADGVREVAIGADGPILEVRVDGVLVTAGREDDLTTGTHAGIAVMGDGAAVAEARFTRLRTRPPEEPGTRTVTPGGGP